MKIDVSPSDKFLITKVTDPKDISYKGKSTSSDPNSCWISFNFHAHLGRTCSISAATLPDGRLSNLPRYVEVKHKGTRDSTIHLPILNSENEGKIRIGKFPRGTVRFIRLGMTDGQSVRLLDTAERGFNANQTMLDVTISDRLYLFSRGLLKKVGRFSG